MGAPNLLDFLRQMGQQHPEEADRLMDLLGFNRPQGMMPAQINGLYWDARHPARGGTQRVVTSAGSPGPDHYRLVDSLEEAQHVFGLGEKPLLIGNLEDINPDEIDPGVLRQIQESQWAAPGGVPLFTDEGLNPAHYEAWKASQGQPTKQDIGPSMTVPSLDNGQ